jgi:hypothetical protein
MKRKLHQPTIFFTIVAFAMLLLSCKKVIQIDFNNSGNLLVIEGNVVNTTSTQTVKISKSVNITDLSNFPAVSGATVTITSEGRVYTLREQTPGIYLTSSLRGQPTKNYQLNVVADGKTYTASSTMPAQVKLDSLNLNITTIVNKDYQSAMAYYTDPATIANYYRFILTVDGVVSKNYFVYDDNLTNGRVVNRDLRDNDLNLVTGDVVNVQMQCVDKNVYQYWNGLSQNESRGGASTTPANPESNISNGALGYFSAHTVQDKQFVVRR